jgi:Zn-dependent protease with chaperone function
MTVPYAAHGVTLALAWFLIVNGLTSIGAAAAGSRWSARERASRFWFLLRLSPTILSAIFVVALFVPSYWRYEPPDTAEGFDVTLTGFALFAAALIGWTCARGAAAWLGARQRAAEWMRTARPFGVHAGVGAFEVDADVPVMALIGVFRPRLIVSASLVAALSRDEMEAGIAHEIAHHSAWDNLKRLLIRLSPDLLAATGAARAMERHWAAAAEQAADSRAGGGDPTMRCALASALVKVARLMPPTAAPRSLEPISTLVDGGDITARVERLLDDRVAAAQASPLRARLYAVVLVSLAIAAGYPAPLVTVHEATEALVQVLP